MIVRFDKQALLENQNNKDKAIGVEGDSLTVAGNVSEAEKILSATRAMIAEDGSSAVGVSACNSGRGHDQPAPVPVEGAGAGAGDKGFTPTVIEGSVEEEPTPIVEEPELMGMANSPEAMQVDAPPKSS